MTSPWPKKMRLAALTTLGMCELISLATGLAVFGFASRAAFAALSLIAWPWMTIRERALFAAALAVIGVVLITDAPFSIVVSALDLAAYFGTFILLITILKEAAARSPSVLTVGHFLTSQPAGRRFYATATGGHLLGIFLNFGAVSLMSPLIQQSAVTADGTPDRNLERRQLSALIRGFSWILLWAPTTLSQAVLLTIFTDVAWTDFVWLGIATAILMTVVGRLYDRFEWPEAKHQRTEQVLETPNRALAVVAGVCIVLIAATFAGRIFFGAPIATSLMFVAPVVTLGWFLAQHPNEPPVTIVERIGPILEDAAPALARSALALGLSGFLGRALANILPIDAIADVLPLETMPGWLFLAALPILINLGGQVALSPILLVVFLGEVLNSLPNLPVENVHILFALSAGWALSMTASPNATATLLISSITQVPPTTLTWRWNLRYGVICYLIFVVIFAIIA